MGLDFKDPKVKKVQEVYQSLWAINKTTAKFTKKNAESFGLTLQQLSILNTLFASPELTQQEIAERLISSKSTISVGVDKLVKLGLVERETSDEDRREVKLKLSNKGEEVSKASSRNSISYKAMFTALENIPEEDIQSLLRIQKELLNHLINSGY
ncbi:MarR family transcriptional regulator [Neobacillus sp. PS3-12]|jgi:MarR family transcriptional regulator, organic hydroperoxide resistance regulator|uniref:MarR family winged helix-turn-helix transcriptional regulator n=1 Tax=Neobacillus sp. PS3-12 TaxID=3070677 RepID=UPI0027E1F451|nr:MarR family transcriptional regulator [Neobacillus sp. PS3-12]WML53289.1 MarR family transcriptional regulator [Neobacillus sp. PS3-12]